MNDLVVTYGGLDYLDRTRALQDGTVKPAGITFRFVGAPPGDLFRRVAHYQEFDAAEMSFSTYATLLDRGDDRWIAIPVFPSRNFRHGYIWVHGRSDIREPKDLVGRKAGVVEYQMTAAVWQRALLMEEYGLMPGDLTWYQGGLITPGYVERNAITTPPGVTIDFIPEDQCLEGMVAGGGLDVLFSPQPPPGFYDGSGRVRRLFPNWAELEQDYFRRTGLFPIMHLVVLNRELYEKNRWMAASLVEAFTRAQQIGWQRLRVSGTLSVMLPWLARDVEELTGLMGPQHWPYGFIENRMILDTMCRHIHEQGLSSRRLQPEELFAIETQAKAIGA